MSFKTYKISSTGNDTPNEDLLWLLIFTYIKPSESEMDRDWDNKKVFRSPNVHNYSVMFTAEVWLLQI